MNLYEGFYVKLIKYKRIYGIITYIMLIYTVNEYLKCIKLKNNKFIKVNSYYTCFYFMQNIKI